MEHGASERVKEQSHTVMPVKTEVDKAAQSTAYCEIQINTNFIKEEPGLVELVKSEPALLMKQEVVEDDWQDIPELQYMQGPSTSAIVGSANVLDSVADMDNVLHVKEELGATDIGPTVLHHKDTWYTTNQDVSVVKEERTINHDKTDPILCGGVKKEIIEDEQRADTDDQRSNKAGQSEQRAQSQLYSCDECGKTYASKGSMMEHYRSLHSTQSHRCTKCKKKFPSKHYLYNHTRQVHSEQQYECAVCKKIYGSKPALHKHVNRVHRPRPAVSSPVGHTCDHCHKTYTSKRSLIHHIDVVHTKVLYRCSECNEEFKGKHLLRGHMKGKHEITSPVVYTCDYCHKTYASKPGLSYHIEVVHTKVLYRCSKCNMEYKSKHLLQGHIKRVHGGLQIHTCEYCQKTFRYKSGLRLHTKNIHVAAHIHRCRRCDMNFKSNEVLQRHNTCIHAQYKCQVCLKFYKTIYTLRRHFKKAHNSKDIQFQSDVHPDAMPDLRLTADVTDAAASTSKQQHNVDVVKEEPADGELELGPVVFQHMDCNYRPYEEEPQDGLGGLM